MIVKCCLFSIYSIKCTKHSHLSPYNCVCRNVSANNNDHFTKSEGPICPTGSQKGTLRFTLFQLQRFISFVLICDWVIGPFLPFKKMGCSLSVEYAFISSCMHVKKPSLPNLQQLAVCLWNCLWLWNAPLCPRSKHVTVFVIVAGKVLLAS